MLDPRFAQLVARGSTFDAIAELGGPLYLSATMVRRDAFLASGGFDPDFDAHEDLDLYLRLARDGAFVAGAGEPVTLYRVHCDEHAVGRALPRDARRDGEAPRRRARPGAARAARAARRRALVARRVRGRPPRGGEGRSGRAAVCSGILVS